ncbi:MAG: translation initiation factor IF-3 [Candidatus Zixiibacteriota bacterium]|nr:MAG: translation initiation factor IF-3 [candidate division Zixibacteria bacterium]
MASKDLRINRRIRISPVRLIGPDGEQIGILPVSEALDRAESLGLDLVEVAPKSRPPVCRILDYGKFKYELSKRDKAAKKKQHSFQMKEMRYRPKIDDHDFEFKTRHVRTFVESGSKVKVFVLFRGREMAYTEYGKKILERVAQELSDISSVEMAPKLDGRKMTMVLAPTPEILKKRKQRKEAPRSEQTTRTSELASTETDSG